MKDDALNAIVLLAAVFGIVHYLSLRLIVLGKGVFQKREADQDDERPNVRVFKP